MSIFFIKDIIQWLRYFFIQLKNTRPPNFSSHEFTGPALKSLAQGLRSSGISSKLSKFYLQFVQVWDIGEWIV